MPVPRRRKASALAKVSSVAISLLDINFLFQKTRMFFLYGLPVGLLIYGRFFTFPAPTWIDLINVLE